MKTKMMIFMLGAAGLMHATGEPLKSAVITTAVNDVRVYKGSESGAAATVGESISGKDDLHTGRRSRAELTFPDQSITRIGANSIFSFSSGNRDMEIKNGSFLLQVPKDAGGATIRTATVTAAITGTTTMMECNPGKWIKFITLEGTAKLKVKGSKKVVEIPPGNMVFMRTGDKQVPKPIMINIQRLVGSSELMGKDFKKLSPEADKLIKETIAAQKKARNRGEVTQAGVIIGGPTLRKGSGRDPNPSSVPFNQSDREYQIIIDDDYPD